MNQKIKVAVESPPRTATIHIEPDQPAKDDYIVIQVRPKPGMEKDAVQFRGQPPPGPGPRKCWACGFEWILEPGGEDVCPRCNRPNVIKEVKMPKIEYVFKERDSSPQEEIERSKRILQQLRSQGETSLTVGDLSVVTENKRERNLQWSRKPINNEQGITIGDLFEGLRGGNIKPSTSKSQRLQWKLIGDWQEKQRKIQETRESLSQEQ